MRTTQTVADVIEVVRTTFRLADEKIDAGTRLLDVHEGLALNSLQLIELAVALEQRYGQQFDTDAFLENDFDTVGSVADLVQRSFGEPSVTPAHE